MNMSSSSFGNSAWQKLASRRGAIALGLLTWLVTALLPCAHRAPALPAVVWLYIGSGPLVLLLGMRALQTHPRAAPYVLLAAFPMALALSVAQLDPELAMASFSPNVAALAVISLLAYGASALTLCEGDESVLPTEQKPLGETRPLKDHSRKRHVGQLALAAVTLGGLGATVWGSWATGAAYRSAWNEAAPQGAALTALVAGLASSLAIAFVGAGLRAERGRKAPARSRSRRVTWLLLVAASGAIVYALLRR